MSYSQIELEERCAALVVQELELGDEPGFHQSVLESLSLSQTLRAQLSAPDVSLLWDTALRTFDRLSKVGISVLPFTDPSYPAKLRHIHNPPLTLLCRGKSFDALSARPAVAIVGSRKADQPGCDTAKSFAKEIAGRGACVISGLAYGIDAAAHRGALASHLPASTIAVLGSGLATGIYPSAHARLAEEIIGAGGLLLSQFGPDAKPYPSNFLDRNRVIAGLSDAALIIQAAQRSGALSTARHAMEEGREVLVVPGDIRDPLYAGSNQLLKQGAALVSTFSDITAQVPGLSASIPTASPVRLSESQRAVLGRLQNGPQLIDDARPAALDISEFSTILFELEEAGLVLRMPGNRLMCTQEGQKVP